MATGNRGGRPKKPTAIHLLNGNPSKISNLEAKAAAEPHPTEYTPGNVPEPPDYLPEDAKQCWQINAPMLAGMRLLTVADLIALEAYCMNYAAFRKLARDLSAANLLMVYRPHAATQPNSQYLDVVPQARELRAFSKEMREWGREFGMSPAARGRMVLPEEKEAEDEMEQLLRGG